jgi:hypothetical protein
VDDHPTMHPAAPWRLLVFDPDPADPKWVLATVLDPGDVRSAAAPDDPEAVAGWVTARTGAARLDPIPGALAWSLAAP